MEKTARRGASKLVRFTKYYYSHQIKEDEMGGACSKHWGDEKSINKFWSEKRKGRDRSEDPGVGGRLI
jgi:hypothetical protein